MDNAARNRDSFMDQLNPFANQIFQRAVLQGDMAIVSLMLKHGTVVRRNERNRHGLTALQQSVLDGNNRLAIRLMESGADLEAKTANGWTSLHIAAATGNTHMVCLLLGHCADVVALTTNDELAIDLAMNVDMKIILANEMSRCGYIELSQWYMGKMSTQESGVFYVMSADSLLEIACDSAELHMTDSYGLYPPSTMSSYSSMINLSRPNGQDPGASLHYLPGAKSRKASVWSLSQQPHHTSGMKYEDTLSRPVPRRKSIQESNQLDTSFVNTERGINTHGASTRHIGTRASPSKSHSSSHLSKSSDQICEQDENSMKSNNPQMLTCQEQNLPDDDVFSADHQVLISNVTETGTMRRIKRKVSIKRKASDTFAQYGNEYLEDGIKPVQLNIDYYYQASMDSPDDFDEDCLEFKSGRRSRLGSNASSCSLGYRGSLYMSSSGSLIDNGDGAECNAFSGDRTLLNEFAENDREEEDNGISYVSYIQEDVEIEEALDEKRDLMLDQEDICSEVRGISLAHQDLIDGQEPRLPNGSLSSNREDMISDMDIMRSEYQRSRSEHEGDWSSHGGIRLEEEDGRFDPAEVIADHEDREYSKEVHGDMPYVYATDDSLVESFPKAGQQGESASSFAFEDGAIAINRQVSFEIDTDNMDGYNEITVEEVNGEQKGRNLSDFDDEEVLFDNGNMYFNPMYRSGGTPSSVSLEKEPRGAYANGLSEKHLKGATSSHKEYVEDHLQGSDHAGQYPSKKEQDHDRRHTIKEQNYLSQDLTKDPRNREVFISDEECKDVKRKKRGLLSELVSKFKDTVKLHRTSSDTNLKCPDEGTVVKRVTGKSKSLRRRRHVRRSNSFSSYFPPVSEKRGRKNEKCEDAQKVAKVDKFEKSNKEIMRNGKVVNGNHRELRLIPGIKRKEKNLTEGPYTAHVKDRSPLSPSRALDHTQIPKQLSPLRQKDGEEGNRSANGGKGHRKDGTTNDDAETYRGKDKVKGIGNCGEFVDNCSSKIPVRSFNTYAKGIAVKDERPGQLDNGCMSMKFLCK